MTTIYLLAINFILSFTSSEQTGYTGPIDLSGWSNLDSLGNSVNCETVGGYNYDTNKIHVYGGENTYGGNDTAKYIFDPSDNTYESEALDHLATAQAITVVGDSTQQISGSILYWVEGTEVKGIDMTNDTEVNTYATFSAGATQPGLCFDDDNSILYVVGNGAIEKCENLNTTPPSCTRIVKSALDMLKEVSCTFYNNSIYIFGGRVGEGDPNNKVLKCDPDDGQQTCPVVSTLSTARSQIKAIRIQCFNNEYVALLGGVLSTLEPTGVVEIYNLAEETSETSILINQHRQFSAVFDPQTEQLYVIGGRSSGVDSSICLNTVQITQNSAGMGLCVTMYPTNNPTIEPTLNPTINPTVPTSNPTMTPTTVPTAGPTDTPVVKPTADTYRPQTEGYTTRPSVYAIIIVILIFICCIIFWCFFFYQRGDGKDKDYGRVVNVAGTVPMAAVVTYCDSCHQATPCDCGSCGKCGKSTCNNDCGYKCNNCQTTSCNGRDCRTTTKQ